MNNFQFHSGEPLVLDGGLGTQLEKKGCDVSSRLWSARVLLDRPDMVEQVHSEYLEAGADCITTASYQVSFEGFSKAGLSRKQTVKALQESVHLAQTSRQKFLLKHPRSRLPIIAASVGPYGASLGDGSEFHGNYQASMRELFTFHSSRLNILHAAGPDILACETIPSLMEAEAILSALRQVSGSCAWFSFTCRDRLHTAHGERLRDCVRVVAKEDLVLAIGVNCTAPELIAPLIEEIRSEAEKPIVVYPNSGQKWNAADRCWVGKQHAEDLGDMAKNWLRLGANWIGGCCGTGPDDIRRVSESVRARG